MDPYGASSSHYWESLACNYIYIYQYIYIYIYIWYVIITNNYYYHYYIYIYIIPYENGLMTIHQGNPHQGSPCHQDKQDKCCQFLQCLVDSDHLGTCTRLGGGDWMVAWTTQQLDHSLDWFCWENLQETHGFLPSNIGLSCKFSHNPILWITGWWLFFHVMIFPMQNTIAWSKVCSYLVWNLSSLPHQKPLRALQVWSGVR